MWNFAGTLLKVDSFYFFHFRLITLVLKSDFLVHSPYRDPGGGTDNTVGSYW